MENNSIFKHINYPHRYTKGVACSFCKELHNFTKLDQFNFKCNSCNNTNKLETSLINMQSMDYICVGNFDNFKCYKCDTDNFLNQSCHSVVCLNCKSTLSSCNFVFIDVDRKSSF